MGQPLSRLKWGLHRLLMQGVGRGAQMSCSLTRASRACHAGPAVQLLNLHQMQPHSSRSVNWSRCGALIDGATEDHGSQVTVRRQHCSDNGQTKGKDK